MDSLRRNWDVVVAGGGPAGSAIALSLARGGFSVLLVERSDYEAPRIGETLPPAIKHLLVGLGLWDSFLVDGHSSSPAMKSAWGTSELHTQDHIFNPYGPGWHIDRARFDAMLAQRAEKAGATLLKNAAVTSCVNDRAGSWQSEIIQNDRRESFTSKFLVDATGRSSSLAGTLGIKRIALDRLVGVTGFLRPVCAAAPREIFALIEAAEDGWWYSTPLPDSHLMLAYMTDADLYAKSYRLDRNYWLGQVERTIHTRSRVSSLYVPVSVPHVVSANTSYLERAAHANYLAVGDAAIAFDPLSGQGVYSALESGMLGAKAIQDHVNGINGAFEEYGQARKKSLAEYLRLRRAFYAEEQRWPHAAFWQRRI